MSRRKQSKPQHVDFPDNNTTISIPAANVPALVGDTGSVKQVLRSDQHVEHSMRDETESTQHCVDDTALCVKAGDSVVPRENADQTITQADYTTENNSDKDVNSNFTSKRSRSHMASLHVTGGEDRRRDTDTADFASFQVGQLTNAHRSMFHPRYTNGIDVQGSLEEETQSTSNESVIESYKERDEKLIEEDKDSRTPSIFASLERQRQQSGQEDDESRDNAREMYPCQRCDKSFDFIGDFVKHNKFDCPNIQEVSPMEGRMDVGAHFPQNEYTENEDSHSSKKNFVISGNLIMANQDNLDNEALRRQEDVIEDDVTSPQADQQDDGISVDEGAGVMLESLNGTRVAMAQSLPENHSADDLEQNENNDMDDSLVSPDSGNRSESPIEQQHLDDRHQSRDDTEVKEDSHSRFSKDEDTDESEKLRKEILATEAMAQAIQNMTSFASQQGGDRSEENPDKPDISAIKYQVRMIQQQQAYQVQMLNFLQWQLALASSNPQAAVAAAAAANSRNGAMTNGFAGLNPTMQPPMMPTPGGIGGAGLMPHMMAMAVSNFQQQQQNAAAGQNGMSELAKARLMMMQGLPNNQNEQGLRNLFSRTEIDQDPMEREPEQRYQLKEPKEDDEITKRRESEEANNEHRNGFERSDSPNKPARSKSDSGYDDDVRSNSQGNAAINDDASSSHGSQEDGELRDGLLKATAEENRHRCRFCHKIFGSDSALQIHIRSHTGERPYKCNICGNRFTTKGNLKVHFTRHKSKYPHIPMNNQPVPEYLDHVPTSNGVPYGMSILPEKAVLERPRLHGNPSIHLNPQQAAALSQRDASHGLPGLMMPHLNAAMNGKPECDLLHRQEHPEMGLPNGMGPAEVASAIQAQLLQRRRAEYLESQWSRENQNQDTSPRPNEVTDPKNPMSILQAAMLPFLPGIAARQQQMENIPPHLRYLHHLHALQARTAANGMGDNNNTEIRLPTLPRPGSPPTGAKMDEKHRNVSGSGFPGVNKMAAAVRQMQPQAGNTQSSETSKLQRLVENIDRGRVLQKNECHMCHRILSCQSALKLHYRTHTGERPYKCDLCSRAFTTRGNLRTHYSSVHRQQMRPLPPGGNSGRSIQPEPFACSLCPARFREAAEYQHHMQMHAMVQSQQQQQRMQAIEYEKRSVTPPTPSSNAVDLSSKMDEYKQREESDDVTVKEEPNEQREGKLEIVENSINGDHDNKEKSAENDIDNVSDRSVTPTPLENREQNQDPMVKNERSMSPKSEPSVGDASRDSNDSINCFTPPSINPLDSLAALSNLGAGTDLPQQAGSMILQKHQLAALSRARAGRLTVCEICEKPFSCQSALEIHIRTHTKERPYMCQICQRSFTTKGNLKQHLLTHNITDIPEHMLVPVGSPNGENSASTTPSSSPTPHEGDNSSYNLKRPLESSGSLEPSAKRSYPRHWCHICQKQFSSASSLQIHNRTHTGEKPFACNVCGRAFTTKGNLKVHMGTHVWGAGGSRRGRRISMDNPLISPWMKNMTRPRPAPQPGMVMPPTGHVTDPAALYQQYAAIASGLLSAKQDAATRFMLPIINGPQTTTSSANSASSPVSSSGSPLPPNEVSPQQNRVNPSNMPNTAVSAATEWFLKAYQRTQEQVN